MGFIIFPDHNLYSFNIIFQIFNMGLGTNSENNEKLESSIDLKAVNLFSLSSSPQSWIYSNAEGRVRSRYREFRPMHSSLQINKRQQSYLEPLSIGSDVLLDGRMAPSKKKSDPMPQDK